LHYRIVQVLYIFLLPFIAVLFVIEPRRNPSPFRFLAGLLVILSFHQFLGMATAVSRKGDASVFITLWLPLLVLSLLVFLRMRWLSTKPGFNTSR
jgi:lipopolysaccharide export system permease protein